MESPEVLEHRGRGSRSVVVPYRKAEKWVTSQPPYRNIFEARLQLTSAYVCALTGPFLAKTYCHNPGFISGCLSRISFSCSRGSCIKAEKLAGAMVFAHRMNPTHSCGFVQTFFVISRERRVVET